MKIGIIIGVVIAIIALVVCLVPLKTVAYTLMVYYEDVETYYEDEPYQVTENYTEDVPLEFRDSGYIRPETREEHHYTVIGDIIIQDEIVEVDIEVAKVDVMNLDNVPGNFTVTFSGFEPMFGEISLIATLHLDPGEQETAECPAESINSWNYTVTPGTKEVEAQRTVTKYRQVEKQRTVTKQRQETHYKRVTVLDYLLHY